MRKLETLDRALLLLKQFDSSRDEFTVATLAERLELHHSSISRMVGTLVERDFLSRDSRSGIIRVGPELRRLGLLALAPHDALAESRTVMEHLVSKINETVVLTILDTDHTIEVAQVDSDHLVGTPQWIGRRSPAHASSSGKVFMAFGGPDLETLELEPITGRTIIDIDDLRSELEQIRSRGWATSIGENEKGLNGVAAPVFDSQGTCVYAINASGPEYRLTIERMTQVGEQTAAAAQELSRRIGWVKSSTAARSTGDAGVVSCQ